MKTITKYFRVDRRKIHLVRFILEGYDGIATLTTIDPHRGIVRLDIPPGCEDDVETVIQDIGKDVVIIPSPAAASIAKY